MGAPNRLPYQGVITRVAQPKNRVAQLASPNGRAMLVMQSDGNLVLSTPEGKILWASKTNGKDGAAARIQADGNFVVVNSHGQPIWASMTNRGGNPQQAWGGNMPYLVVQDDGNMVLYSGNTPLWDTKSNGFVNRQDEGGWLENVAQTAGRVAGSAVHLVAQASSTLQGALHSVPVLGPGLAGVYGYTYGAAIKTGDAIAHGQRIDQAALNYLKDQIHNVKDVAPYAQLVIKHVPVVGPGASGAIQAGLDIASGRRVDDSLIDGAATAGYLSPNTANALKAGAHAAQGLGVDPSQLASLPLTNLQKVTMGAIAQQVKNMQSGTIPIVPVAVSNLNDQIEKLPPGVRDALKAGLAMGQAKRLQDIAQQALPEAIVQLGRIGNMAAQNDPAVAAARNLAPKAGVDGFNIGMGLMQHAASPTEIASIRDQIKNGDQRKAFDMALAYHSAQVTRKPAVVITNPVQNAGYMITQGMRGQPNDNVKEVLTTVAQNPQAATGALQAVKDISNAKKPGFYEQGLAVMRNVLALRKKKAA